MALSEQISCDICGVVKQQANHWILYHSVKGLVPTVYFTPWDYDYTFKGHLCGESCAHKMLAKAIEDWGRGNGEA